MKTTPVHQRLETPTGTDTQEHVYHKPVRDVNELKQQGRFYVGAGPPPPNILVPTAKIRILKI